MRKYTRRHGVEAAIVEAFRAGGNKPRQTTAEFNASRTRHPEQLPGHVARRVRVEVPRLAVDAYDKCLVIEACKSHASWEAMQRFRRGQIFRQMLDEIQSTEDPGTRIRLERAIRRAEVWAAKKLRQTEEETRATLVARHQEENIESVKRNLDDIVRRANELHNVALAGVHLMEHTQNTLERSPMNRWDRRDPRRKRA